MKSMHKQTLINSKQIKYAISESEIMSTLKHPYLVQLYYSFQTPEYLHMLMEFVSEGDLGQWLDESENLDEDSARFIAA